MDNLKIAGVSLGVIALVALAGWIGYEAGRGDLKATNPDGDLWQHQFDLEGTKAQNVLCLLAPISGVQGENPHYDCRFWFSVNAQDFPPMEVMSISNTGSMYPTLHAGTVAVAGGTFGADLQVGDIIGYGSGVGVVFHRVVRITNKCIYTKGDANPFMDNVCLPLNISYRRVVAIFP